MNLHLHYLIAILNYNKEEPSFKVHIFFSSCKFIKKNLDLNVDSASIQRFVSSTGNMEVLLSHTHSIVCALAYF